MQTIADALGYKLNITKSEFADAYPTGYSMTGDPHQRPADRKS